MIQHPPLVDVQPGDPISAEAWNNVLTSIKTVYDFLNAKRGSLTVHAKTAGDGVPVGGAIVTVKPTGDTAAERPARSAPFMGAGINAYQVESLLPGPYEVVVEAAGFNPETRQVTMDEIGDPLDIAVELTATVQTAVTPNLFGIALVEAIEQLTKAGLTVGRLVDAHGTVVDPLNIPEDSRDAAVLTQWPEAGTPVAVRTQLFLGISARAEFLARVTVPDVRGLTIDEAKSVLEAKGLGLGDTSSVAAKAGER